MSKKTTKTKAPQVASKPKTKGKTKPEGTDATPQAADAATTEATTTEATVAATPEARGPKSRRPQRKRLRRNPATCRSRKTPRGDTGSCRKWRRGTGALRHEEGSDGRQDGDRRRRDARHRR